MSEIEPITREEVLLNSIVEGTGSEIKPITRKEMYLSAIAGETELPADMNPITREEIFLQKVLDNGTGGGGEAEGTVQIAITQNGTITRNVARYASAEITTNVPNPSTGTKQISSNGTHDVTDFASADVNVSNSYTSSDEGKVVDNGALVSQTSKNITANGTVDTTLNNSVVVNVPQGITPTGTKQISITQNGTTTEDVTNYANAEITVNVSGSGDSYAEDFKAVIERTATNLNLPSNLTTIGPYAFAYFGSLKSIILPSGVTSIGTCAFQNCTSLESIQLPSGLTGSISHYTFQGSSRLPLIDLPSGVTNIALSAFSNCKALATMILRRSDAVCALANVNALANTPIGGYNGLTGKVYVPSALIESYKVASNWSTIYSAGTVEFVAIEGSEYDD